jgi:pimeloyl-ACP methyl ester carboxylesterase
MEQLAPCDVGLDGVEALCGSYEVWENRATRSGRRISLNLVVIPAQGEERLPDPVFFFHGGPGGAATEVLLGIWDDLRGVRDQRDLVFIDQRGTGGSHPLDCVEPDEYGPAQAFFDEMLDESYVRECLARQDADVRQYTTPIAMDDVNEVRQALGYEQINLYGSSYGTRAAQVYLRRHTSSVRTAVLKGVAPMDMKNPLPFAQSLERGARAVIEACAEDSTCHQAFPDLAEEWQQVKARFDDGPVSAEIFQPRTRQKETVTISRGVFADGMRHILYSVQDARSMPRIIHAAANGDFTLFAQRNLILAIGYTDLLSGGMFLTVTCSEDLAFLTEEEVRQTDGTFLGDYRIRRQQQACAIWGTGAGVSDQYTQPVKADTPVLLLSGELDTATPPSGAEVVARHLPRSRHIIFPNESHGFANYKCETRIIGDFINQGSADELDTTCVSETKRPPFTT